MSRIAIPKIFEKDGPLSQQLALKSAPFGIGQVLQESVPDATTRSVCGFCSTGCNLTIHRKELVPINLSPTIDYPVNFGMACPKGWESLRVLESSNRATVPLLRDKHQALQPVSWSHAMETFCSRFQGIQRRHGASSVAFLSTGQIPSEEMALLGCLAKFGMGLVHGDGNTRQCMATSVAAYKQSFGFDAPPFTYADFEESDCLCFVGANPCIAHPILWQRVLRNPHRPEIIVLDPRKTETAMAATEHVPLRPKSDLVALYGLANLLIEMEAVDENYIAQHTQGYEAFRDHVRNYSLERLQAETKVAKEQWRRVAIRLADARRASFWWTMGVNQSHQGVRTAQAIINLALMTGNMGRPGTGANSITGQCNAMGSRLFSNTTNLIGHHDFANPTHRDKVANILDIPVDRIPSENSWAYDQILDGIESGAIRGLWVIATNTAHSWIHSPRARDLLNRLEFLVVQDMYANTETALHADLVLPAAGWGEKEGTLINSERRIGVIRKVAKAPGQALSDFSIFRLVAEQWGCGEMFRKWTSPQAVFEILKQITIGQPCDISGIQDYETIEACGGIQWPWSAAEASLGSPKQERRLFENGSFFHADGKARFIFESPKPMLEQPDSQYPWILLTGRGSVSQWHTQTRTSQSPVLRTLSPKEPYVEMNPEDAMRQGLQSGELVTVISRRGNATVRLVVTATVARGQLFMPMHDAQTNHLTLSHVDPVSRQPAFKDCAVRIQRGSMQ